MYSIRLMKSITQIPFLSPLFRSFALSLIDLDQIDQVCRDCILYEF